jgi:hypothetical protein
MTRSKELIPLPNCFVLSDGDVVCARGKEATHHLGNIRYRNLIKAMLGRYASANTKQEKSFLVSEILDTIQQSSPYGGFVKKQNGTWYQISNAFAKEKIGQNLRDELYDMYQSSTKAKRYKRVVHGQEVSHHMESFLQENEVISLKMEQMANYFKAQEENRTISPEVFVMDILNKVNLDILEAIKQDHELVEKFIQVDVKL